MLPTNFVYYLFRRKHNFCQEKRLTSLNILIEKLLRTTCHWEIEVDERKIYSRNAFAHVILITKYKVDSFFLLLPNNHSRKKVPSRSELIFCVTRHYAHRSHNIIQYKNTGYHPLPLLSSYIIFDNVSLPSKKLICISVD